MYLIILIIQDFDPQHLIRNVFLTESYTLKYSNSYQTLIQQDAISYMNELHQESDWKNYSHTEYRCLIKLTFYR